MYLSPWRCAFLVQLDPRHLRGKIPHSLAATMGLKSVEPLTKHQKAITANLMFHIYRKHHSHLRTSIGQLLVGDFFFAMISCKYSTNPKGENKTKRILRKKYIKLYRKPCELLHSTVCIHLSDKVSLTFQTQKNDQV